MEAEHFRDWIYQTAGCCYNQKNQAWCRKLVKALEESQLDTGISDYYESDGRVDDDEGTCDTTQDDVPQGNMDVDMNDPKGDPANLAVDANPGHPAAGIHQEGDMVAENAPHMNTENAAPRPVVSSYRRVTLDPQTMARVDELLQKIPFAARFIGSNTWSGEEEELMEPLRSHKMSYRQIAEEYMTRHTASGCTTRATKMRLRAKRWEMIREFARWAPILVSRQDNDGAG